MKKLLFLAVLFPLAASAQKVEVSAFGGTDLRFLSGSKVEHNKPHFTQRYTATYNLIKWLRVGGYFETGKISGGDVYGAWNRNTFGLQAEVSARHVYAAADLGLQTFAGYPVPWYKCKRSLQYGLHAGAIQHLTARLRLKEELAVSICDQKATVSYYTGNGDPLGNGTGSVGPVTQVYAFAGLSYSFLK